MAHTVREGSIPGPSKTMMDASSAQQRQASLGQFRKLLIDGRGYFFHVPTSSVLTAEDDFGEYIKSYLGDSESALHGQKQNSALLAALETFKQPSVDARPWKVSHLAISPTLDCNLNCTYCYNYMESPPEEVRHLPKLEKAGIARILEFLDKVPIEDHLSISYIGGEPLLRPAHLDSLIRLTKHHVRRLGKTASYLATTNGLNLGTDRSRQLILRHGLVVSISIDGPEEWHDSTRKLPTGGGSYATLRRSIDKFFTYYHTDVRSARATVRLLPGRLVQTYRHLLDIGFNDIAMGTPDFESCPLDERRMSELINETQELAAMVEADFLSGRLLRHSWFTDVITSLYHGHVKQIVCGATRNHLAFDVYGRTQACHRYLGNTEYSISLQDLRHRHASPLIAAITKPGKTAGCSECWARGLCGGECFHIGKELRKTGDYELRQKYICDFKRSVFEAAVAMYVRLWTANSQLVASKLVANRSFETAFA